MAPAVRVISVDALTVEVFETSRELASAAAEAATRVLAATISERGAANAMFASGNSQLAFLEALARCDGLDWSRVTGFHMDEYVGLEADHPASFARYMREHVVETLQLATFHAIDGAATDSHAECERYAGLLRDHPLDLCCLGIGENGHLAFNDPPVADFEDALDVKVVELDAACRRQQVGEGHFAGIVSVPEHAVTVTIPTLLRARRVLAIVPERRKAGPVRRALEGPIERACPASVLRRTPHATLFLDRDSSALLT